MRSISALVLMVLVASASVAEERETFASKVQKLAVPLEPAETLSKRAKSLCWCPNPGNPEFLGVLVQTRLSDGMHDRIALSCRVPAFDPVTGDFQQVTSCSPFEILR